MRREIGQPESMWVNALYHTWDYGRYDNVTYDNIALLLHHCACDHHSIVNSAIITQADG